MLKTFIGSLAVVTLSAASLGADERTADVSTWRWHVNSIIDSQRARETPAALDRVAFQQDYERYSATGLPEAK